MLIVCTCIIVRMSVYIVHTVSMIIPNCTIAHVLLCSVFCLFSSSPDASTVCVCVMLLLFAFIFSDSRDHDAMFAMFILL